MKIIIYGINYHPEVVGTGKYTYEMARYLQANGFDVKVITANPYYPKWRIFDGYNKYFYSSSFEEGIEIVRCPLYVPDSPNGLQRIMHLLSFTLSSLPVIILSIFWRPKIIWTVQPTLLSSFNAIILSKLTFAKSWMHIQDFEVDAAFNMGILKNNFFKKLSFLFEKLIYKSFTIVSTISKKMQEKLIAKGVEDSRTFLFPNWVNTNVIKPLDQDKQELKDFKSKTGIKKNEFVVMYSGNIGEKQGLEEVVNTAKLLTEHDDIKIILCGDGGGKEKLKSLSSGLRNIIWLNTQPNETFNLLLNIANVHLLPQIDEIEDLVMPSKLTGIFSSGKPVIASAQKDSEVYNQVLGKGLIIDKNKAKYFCEAILKLKNDRNLCIELGNNARAFAIERLEKHVILNKFKNEIQRK